MRIHHLNCGTMCPHGGRLVSGEPGAARIVCHCLLIEGDDELVLVDTGLGLDDVRHPRRRLGTAFTAAFGIEADVAETAVEQVRRLGFEPADVRHIAVTHLDLDHAGGLPDFPDAEVHVFGPEQRAATRPTLRERARYKRCHFAHGPNWRVHEAGGDDWFGFESLRVLPAGGAEVLLIPLPGHSRGHSAVAVRDESGWLLLCGDAYYHRDEVGRPPSCPPALRVFQRVMAADGAARARNQERLRELAERHHDEVHIFCSHDPVEFGRECDRAT